MDIMRGRARPDAYSEPDAGRVFMYKEDRTGHLWIGSRSVATVGS